MNKLMKWISIFALAFVIGCAASAIYVEYFHPKIEYEIEPVPITVAYTDIPLNLEILARNATYTYNDYETTTAINVSTPCQLTIGFNSINATHFSSFTVELWNCTAAPYTLIDSFNMTSGPVTLDLTNPVEIGYYFVFTVLETAPYGESGIVELEVIFQQP